jgi:hypothetical protein
MSLNRNTDPASRRTILKATDANVPTLNPSVDLVTFPTLTGARTLFLPNPNADKRVIDGHSVKLAIGAGPTAGSTLTVSCPAVGAIPAVNINGAATLVLATDFAGKTVTWCAASAQWCAA